MFITENWIFSPKIPPPDSYKFNNVDVETLAPRKVFTQLSSPLNTKYFVQENERLFIEQLFPHDLPWISLDIKLFQQNTFLIHTFQG